MSNSSNDNIDIYNVDKRISDLTYENIDKHDKAMLLCRTGQPANPEDRPRNHNQKLENQYEGLKATISHQQHLLSGNCSSVIRTNCKNKWNKKFKTQEEIKQYYNTELKSRFGGRGPQLRKPNANGYYETVIGRKRGKGIYSCDELYEVRKWSLNETHNYTFHPCYENINDKSTLQFWIIHY